MEEHRSRPSRRRPHAPVAVALLILVATSLMTIAQPASAATSRGPCYYFDFDGIRFHNYDYTSTAAYCNNVDWTTNLMFYNNASINRVKGILQSYGYDNDSSDGMHMEVRTNHDGTLWDRDGGKKIVACPTSGRSTPHYRVYAPPGRDYMYTYQIGYFVVGSTHRDKNECPPIGKAHYNNEQVENEISALMRNGYQVDEDWADYLNWEPYRVEGNHTWENNGYASYVRIP